MFGPLAFDVNTRSFRRREKSLEKLRIGGKCPPTSAAAEKYP